MLRSALTYSCHHRVNESFEGQLKRLELAGYPRAALWSCVNKLIRHVKSRGDPDKEKKRIEVNWP